MAKHSNVFYVYKKVADEKYDFEALEKAVACKNDFGLDLFRHKDSIYEGRTGCKVMSEGGLPQIANYIQKVGGIEKFNANIEKHMKLIGTSPRYTRPDERKKDIFPPKPKDPNTIFAKDSYGKKHHYCRFYNENCIELYTLRNDNDVFRRIYIQCEGYMLDIGSHHNLERVLAWLAGLENGMKGEVERLFSESMADPNKYVDIGLANVLGRADEAEAHNTPIREARAKENKRRTEERVAERAAWEQATKEKYKQAIKDAENNLMNKNQVLNSRVLDDKSLIMQLFREHYIDVPLKTRGWIINSLHYVYFNENNNRWTYSYSGNKSTVFLDYFRELLSSIQTKHRVVPV